MLDSATQAKLGALRDELEKANPGPARFCDICSNGNARRLREDERERFRLAGWIRYVCAACVGRQTRSRKD